MDMMGVSSVVWGVFKKAHWGQSLMFQSCGSSFLLIVSEAQNDAVNVSV